MAHLKTTVLILITFLVNSVNAAGDQTYTARTHDGSVETLDQVSYIFPARGEFVYLQNENITVQIRTDYPTSDNHATAYITALALKEDGILLEVYRDTNSTMMSVFNNSVYMCNSSGSFHPCIGGTILAGKHGTDEIILINSKGIKSMSRITLKSKNGIEVELKVTAGNHSNVRGLAGGLVGDELYMGNGSTLPYNITVTTPKQLYGFGESWRVRNTTESLFNYTTDGGNYTYYNTPIIAPVFLEDRVGNLTDLFNQDSSHPHNSSEIDSFNTTCQGNSECLLAIARTNDIQAGKAIIDRIKKQKLAQRIKDNTAPEFLPNFPVEITLVLGVDEVYMIDLTAFAKDNDTANPANLNYTVDTSLPSNQYFLEEGVFRWNITEEIRNLTEFRLQFSVLDEFFGSDVSKPIALMFCGCENSSQCVNSSNKVPDNDNLKVMECTCGKYASGKYCEIAVPACEIELCYETDKCNNSVPQGTNPCAPCPSGYDGDGRACTDIDECAVDKCQQLCNNTIGSYTCSCDDGYTLNGDNTICDNIDECTLKTDSCKAERNEECKDTQGSFVCVCTVGYYKNKDNTCESEASVGRYVYYSELSISVRPIQNMDGMNTSQKDALKKEFTNILTKLLVGNKTSSSLFSFITITQIVYVGGDATSISIYNQRSKRAISGTGFRIKYKLHSKSRVNSTVLDNQIKAAAQNVNTTEINVYGNPVPITLNVHSFMTHNDSANTICEDPERTITCDVTTECQSDKGDYICKCKTGYQKSSTGPDRGRCYDIDECGYQNISNMCIKGTCVNANPGWNCSCPNATYKTWRQTADGIYRCQGNFQYIGNLSLTWQRAPYQNKSLVESFAVKTVTNVYNQSMDRYIDSETNTTMKDIFNYVEVQNIIVRSSFGTIVSVLDVIFILHLGETVPTQWVDSVLKSTNIKNGTFFEFSGIHGTITHMHIYADSNKSMCDIPGRTKCSLHSTTCVGKRGTYSCQCKTGFDRTKADSPYTCSNIDECKESGYRCTNGTCINTDGGWKCTCDQGYTTQSMNDTTKTCIDIDECSDNETYKCFGGKCTNDIGSWTCTCPSGYHPFETYKDMSYICTDIDECQAPTEHMCSHGGKCSNNNGNWTCVCPTGRHPIYVNSSYILCNDIDECTDSLYTCEGNSANCSNTDGAWDCKCDNGFRQKNTTDNKRECVDINECETEQKSCKNPGECANTIGDWYCQCPSGYTNDSKSCTDINECGVYSSSACQNALGCTNTVGSWDCTCKRRLKLKVINETNSKICKGDLEFFGSVGLITYGSSASHGNVIDVITNVLMERLDALYEELLGENLIEIEIIQVIPTVRTKRATNNGPEHWRAEYIIHTEYNTTNDDITNATTEVNKHINDQLVNETKQLTMFMEDTVLFTNDRICQTARNTCDKPSTECHNDNGKIKCNCKSGFIRLPGINNDQYCTDVDECDPSEKKGCKGGTCSNILGSWTCSCKTGFNVNGTDGQQKECISVCANSKCHTNEGCEPFNNDDGYVCRCTPGLTGAYCEEKIKFEEKENDDSSQLQTIAIATGTSLGGLVLILIVVILVVCRLRSQKAKEAEALASGRTNNGFNDFDGSFLGQNYLADHKTGFYDSGSINDGHRTPSPSFKNNSNFNEYIANPVYSKPNKTGRPPSPSPDYEADRINPNSLRPVRVLPNRADIDRRIPSPDYDPPRDYGSERLNVSHDSRMNGYAHNGSLDRNYRRGRLNNELRYSSLDRDVNRSQRVTQF